MTDILSGAQSREYKYNRQAFDQKARLMTEKYAKGGIEGSSSSPHVIQTNSNSSVVCLCIICLE